jgi:hypothetical protein
MRRQQRRQLPGGDCRVSISKSQSLIGGCQLSSAFLKAGNRQLPTGGDPIGNRAVEGERESWEVINFD